MSAIAHASSIGADVALGLAAIVAISASAAIAGVRAFFHRLDIDAAREAELDD